MRTPLTKWSSCSGLKTSLESSVTSLNEISQIIERQRFLMADVPNLWPVAGGGGHISALFGPDIHPFGGYWYIHKGVDIGSFSGAPLVATANGEVYEVGYDKKRVRLLRYPPPQIRLLHHVRSYAEVPCQGRADRYPGGAHRADGKHWPFPPDPMSIMRFAWAPTWWIPCPTST